MKLLSTKLSIETPKTGIGNPESNPKNKKVKKVECGVGNVPFVLLSLHTRT
jgi:hypothetical protein